jgi:deoxyribodipyrimidine photolyase-related protein
MGDKACPFNALYWNFFDRHRTHFQNNPRLGVVYHQLGKMSPETMMAIRQQTARLEKLDMI